MVKVAAIPTMYGGVQFRSRLEARWAAFFDLVGWPWEYEPIDLDGYIPDFILTFETPVLVEVKPAMKDCGLSAAIEKIERSGWDGEALIVGAAIFQGEMGPYLGLLAERQPELIPAEGPLPKSPILASQSGPEVNVAQIGAAIATAMGSHPWMVEGDCLEWCWDRGYASKCRLCGIFSFFHGFATYTQRACGHYEGDHYLGEWDPTPLWREAGNRVQWKSPTGREETFASAVQRHRYA